MINSKGKGVYKYGAVYCGMELERDGNGATLPLLQLHVDSGGRKKKRLLWG